MQHHFFVNVKSNICSEMSCLLKQWLVIKCTEDALHLPQCTSMYVCKIYITSSSSLCTLSHSSFVSLPFKKRMGWGKGGTYFNGAWPRVWVLNWEGCLLKGRCVIWGNMICTCFCVANIVLYYFRWFLLIFQVKKTYGKNTFDITCFLLFRNKNKPVCFAKSEWAEWDINL